MDIGLGFGKGFLKGRSLMGWFNYIILQWFCIRLCRKYNQIPFGKVFIGYSFMYWVKPTTGWSTHFVILGNHGKQKFTRLFWG